MTKIYILLFSIFAVQFLNAQCINLDNCPAAALQFCDLTPNDPQFWNENFWNDPVLNVHDLSESPVQLTLTATDQCASNVNIQYLLFLDTDGNGTLETVVSSTNLPAAGTVNFDNVNNPGYTGGIPQNFDERPVGAADKYRFAIKKSVNGGSITADVQWNTQNDPNTYVYPQLPYGVHKIKWIVTNDLGEQKTCEYTFVVKDCKKPTVVCINGLSVNIMPTSLITLWASDFLQYTVDNATPANQLIIGLRRSGQGTGFPVDGNGDPQTSVTFNCSDLGTQIVELWSIDKAGNADYCETYVLVQDNLGNCPADTATLVTVCARMWCNKAIIPVQSGEMNGSGNGIPSFSYNLPPNAQGCVEFHPPTYSNFTVTLSLDTDPLNGVTIVDLVKIAKHILGIEPLSSPYALIAADANKSGSITSFDLVELRKLLIGAYSALPGNTSWRFVDSSFVFPNPANPFQTAFPENKSVANILSGEHIAMYGVKIGDVDCSAIPGFQAPNEDRAPAALLTLPDAFLQTGESIELPLQFAEQGRWLGLQFGLDINPQLLEIESYSPGELPGMDKDMLAQPRPGLLNGLWYQALPTAIETPQTLARVRVRALAPLWLHDGIILTDGASDPSGRRLRSEAFRGDESRNRLQLEFRQGKDASGAFTVFAPLPNPTRAGVTIGMELPESAPVSWSLLDISGKLLFQNSAVLQPGFTQLDIPAAAFGAPGLYIWQVKSGTQVRMGKVVRF